MDKVYFKTKQNLALFQALELIERLKNNDDRNQKLFISFEKSIDNLVQKVSQTKQIDLIPILNSLKNIVYLLQQIKLKQDLPQPKQTDSAAVLSSLKIIENFLQQINSKPETKFPAITIPDNVKLVDEIGNPINWGKLIESINQLQNRFILNRPKLGGHGGPARIDNEVPGGAINGLNVTFTLANRPVLGTEKLYVNGSRQQSGGGDYTISGLTITFITAPPTGSIILCDYERA